MYVWVAFGSWKAFITETNSALSSIAQSIDVMNDGHLAVHLTIQIMYTVTGKDRWYPLAVTSTWAFMASTVRVLLHKTYI